MRKGTEINLHDFLPVSMVNGPGKRSVLWVQGCHFDCPGCFNQPARSFISGLPMTVPAILGHIDAENVEGVTISGGEPFCQADSLIPLCGGIKDRGLSLMLYTGYTLSRLLEHEDPAFRTLLAMADILVDGPYERDNPPDTIWAGSGNQQVHFLTARYRHWQEMIKEPVRYEEIIIGRDGSVIVTGF